MNNCHQNEPLDDHAFRYYTVLSYACNMSSPYGMTQADETAVLNVQTHFPNPTPLSPCITQHTPIVKSNAHFHLNPPMRFIPLNN